MTDPNSASAWDTIYLTEGGIATWRTYPKAFAAVRQITAICKCGHKKEKHLECEDDNGFHCMECWTKPNGCMDYTSFPQSVLEFGCGVGILAKLLSDDGHFVTGVDISPFAIKTMAREFGIAGQIWDMRDLPTMFATGEFDWVVATEFLEHFTEFDANRIVKEAARVGKRAIFIVPNNTLPPHECKEHLNTFTPYSLTLLLLKHYKHVKLAAFDDIFEIDPSIYLNGVIALRSLLAECSNLED